MICVACGYQGDHGGPGHAYMSPLPGCLAGYGAILACGIADARDRVVRRTVSRTLVKEVRA